MAKPPPKETPEPSSTGPSEFKMPIQGGMLEALGINMYTTLGKCIVEFIANAYDGEATRVDISIPIDQINEARIKVREAARAAVKAGTRDAYDALLDPLPSTVAVTIIDDGHGMSWQDVQDKFLPLNRKRRASSVGKETELKSETGKRFVMGRKGLGKLAGFGAAQHVEVTTKRAGQTFSTTITLDDAILKNAPNVTDVKIPATYEQGQSQSTRGTTIRLSSLKADSVKGSLDALKEVIIESFSALRPDEFSIYLNGDLLKPQMPAYEFMWPAGLKRGSYVTEKVSADDVPEFEFRYYVGFRKRNEHLPARKRGARVYCNNRLAAGPALFGLATGMHSFHSVDYLECIVEADDLDRSGIDFINTNRSQLKEDNEVVRVLLERITSLMTEAIKGHAKFREEQAEEEVKNNPEALALRKIVDSLPRKTRSPAQKLLNALAAQFGVVSPEFKQLAPILINSVNATDVLVRLIELQTKPETIERVAAHLAELGEIEKTDALKLYRGRRSGITALTTLIGKGEDQWGKSHLEKEVHTLLKENAWLIRPEFSQFVTSDQDMSKVVTALAKKLGVDSFAKIQAGDKDDETRPDLVFLLGDQSSGPHAVYVIELKSPTFGLSIDHYRQLEDYMAKVVDWCEANSPNTTSVRGILIGAMPKQPTSSPKQNQLLKKFRGEGPEAQIKIVGLRQLLDETYQSHIAVIKTLEGELEEDVVGEAVRTLEPGGKKA